MEIKIKIDKLNKGTRARWAAGVNQLAPPTYQLTLIYISMKIKFKVGIGGGHSL